MEEILKNLTNQLKVLQKLQYQNKQMLQNLTKDNKELKEFYDKANSDVHAGNFDMEKYQEIIKKWQ